MKLSEKVQNLLLAAGAALLLGALFFLYRHTEGADLLARNEVSATLRDLKNIDARWDVDLLRARTEATLAPTPVADRGPAVLRALTALDAARTALGSPALDAALPVLTPALRRKSELMGQLGTAAAAARAGLDGLLRNAGEIGSELPPQKGRGGGLEATLARLAAVAPQYFRDGQDASQKALEAALAELQAGAAGLPDALRLKAEQAHNAGLQLLKNRPAELTATGELARLTAGARLDALSFEFMEETTAALETQERYRAYLIAYATALLILVGYLVGNLRAANIGLEHRVEERTRELSEALRHLKESEAQLIQSEKMSSLGQMVAGVAHEVNTPLAYVKNSLGAVADRLPTLANAVTQAERLVALLQAGPKADPQELSAAFAQVAALTGQLKQNKVIDELKGLVNDGLFGADQMAEIVGNLKDFSRLDRSKVTSFNLNDGLNSTLMLAKHLLKSVSVERKFGEVPAVICSPSQINQVFLNLVTNAVQAMDDGRGKLTLSTRVDGEGVAVDVADSGKGIPPDVLSKIFDPFFTTKEIGKGTGLGLSISYKIVQQHGGRISVDSTPGAGTTFTVWLPLKPPAEADLAA